MKQEERRHQTIQLLLHSTKELIHDKGCFAITMADIMTKSGLSKGAIFHYVKSKNEIFAWVLRERVEQINERFMNEVKQGDKSFEGPMSKITERLWEVDDKRDITNQVFLYLIGQEEDPAVAEIVKHFYEFSVQLSKQWIETGQQHGVISKSIDSDAVAEMFVLLTLGLRVRSSIPVQSHAFSSRQFASFMAHILKERND